MPVTRECFEWPWRVQCPQGHQSLRVSKVKDTAWCKYCNHTYPFARLQDRRDLYDSGGRPA